MLLVVVVAVAVLCLSLSPDSRGDSGDGRRLGGENSCGSQLTLSMHGPPLILSKAVAFPPFVCDWGYQKIFIQHRDDCEIFSPRSSPPHTVVLQWSFLRECAYDNDTRRYVQRCTSSIFSQISTYVLYRLVSNKNSLFILFDFIFFLIGNRYT